MIFFKGIVPYDPNYNSTFIYDKKHNELLVGTVSDIAAHDALLYQLKVDLSNNTKGSRTPNNKGIFNGNFCKLNNKNFLFKLILY